MVTTNYPIAPKKRLTDNRHRRITQVLPQTGTANALGDCRITSIIKAAMLSAIQDQPRFWKLFIDHLLSRNSRIEEDVIDQPFNSSERRIARLPLLLANYGKEANPSIVPVTLSQETLAEIIGTTRSRVSFFVNNFRKLGLVDYNGNGQFNAE
jgi:CRP/FNR family transcriptional regulator, cyclic AMP receptor protein